MAKYKKYSHSQIKLIPVDYSKQLLSGTFEYTINYLVDNHIDCSVFDKKYKNDDTGAPAYDPKILLKIVLFGYSRGINSSRRLARACKENIIFKALSADSEPDFSTIASFISSMKTEIVSIFENILLVCYDMDLIGGTTFAVDGCKITSNASKEWSGTFKDFEYKKKKLQAKLQQLLEQHKAADNSTNKSESESHKEANTIIKLQKTIAKIELFLSENESKKGAKNNELQSNITDNDSATLISNHGTIQGHNGMAISDSKHQIIMEAETFGSSAENQLLKPTLEHSKQMLANIGLGKEYFESKIMLLDSNYFSEKALEYLSNEKINAYVPDPEFRDRDPRFAGRRNSNKKFSTTKDFIYNEIEDNYICPAKKILSYKQNIKKKVLYRIYTSQEKDCKNCPLRAKCLKKATTKARYLSISPSDSYSKQMIAKIDTPEGIKIYGKRMGMIEPIFANITYAKRLNRFTLRGKPKVDIQWKLYCLVHNIGKICNYGDFKLLHRTKSM